nr:MAG TPA: DNA gyrase inhibitor [Caudoviricetes sp.]
MTKKGLRMCCVCHEEYSFCPVCNSEDRNKPTWYFAYCSENCKDIYTVTSDYEDKKISADDAKKQLDKLDLSQIANFGESYQKAIMKINENATPVKNTDVVEGNKSVISDESTDIPTKYYRKSKVKKVKDDGDIE